MEEKSQLRKRYRRERADRYVPASYSNLLQTPEVQSASVVTSYISYQFEPNTLELNKALLTAGKQVLLPRVNGEHIDWVAWDGDESKLVEKKKILEPIGEVVTDTSAVGVVIVPALRIDREGFRLGQGGGFYDRALPSLPGWKVGIVHAGELTNESLPRESHDIALDAGATPEIIVRFKR